MGQSESSPDESNMRNAGTSSGVAFHVLRVAERSPAAEAGIEPFFDFLAGINGEPLGDEIDNLTRILEANEGRTMILQVWSTKRKELRDVSLVPSTAWSRGAAPGNGAARPSLLGLSLRVCNPKHALEQVWHVLEILEGSPAESAGLVPFGDWIIGYSGGVLRGEGDFYDIVEAHIDKPLRLFVYNADYDVTRETILVPNRYWGGDGLLGCGVGYGLLHRIPRPQDRKPSHMEEEEDERDEQILSNDQNQRLNQPNNNMTSPMDGYGYEEVGYEDPQRFAGFSASEGVEIVAKEEENGGFDDDENYTRTSPSFGRSNSKSSMAPQPLMRQGMV